MHLALETDCALRTPIHVEITHGKGGGIGLSERPGLPPERLRAP
jgi:hypothetical protein